ncbi:hypothetical protein KDK_51980 [Dictyobacter kobayashii]|uniref:Uncharacterized protein n=1 Tax=Dictyobacter kobayashii TaxID=2014872 RepID=A0A402AQF4_9CHLR|nr:hypothetical protein KDK_51980 [Dictyobacter kobayashii]
MVGIGVGVGVGICVGVGFGVGAELAEELGLLDPQALMIPAKRTKQKHSAIQLDKRIFLFCIRKLTSAFIEILVMLR